MKKIIFTLLFSLFTILGYSQNFIGNSTRDINKSLDEKGFILGQGYTDDGVFYITGSDKESVRIYYFAKNNVCYMYALSYIGYTYANIKEALKSVGYWESTNGNFYTDRYQASIVWFNEYSCYFVIILPRLD